jgi:hypothetical protein
MSELQRTIFSEESPEFSERLTVSIAYPPRYGLQVGPEKRPWDMPTSQSNSGLETRTQADTSGPISFWPEIQEDGDDSRDQPAPTYDRQLRRKI